MPENWTPGQPIKIPDPNDPTGKTFIEMPADQLDIMAVNPDGQVQPAIGADIVNPDPVAHPIQGKKKKKKKKKLLNTDTLPEGAAHQA